VLRLRYSSVVSPSTLDALVRERRGEYGGERQPDSESSARRDGRGEGLLVLLLELRAWEGTVREVEAELVECAEVAEECERVEAEKAGFAR
jgi:hypothetical protein